MKRILSLLGLVLLWPALLAAQDLARPAGAAHALGQKTSLTVPASSYLSVYVDLRSNTQQARFAVTGSSGNIDLMLKRGVPHRGSSVQALLAESAFSATTAAGDEVLLAQRGDTPMLTAGRWWLAVLNLSASPQTIDLQFAEAQAGAAYALGAGQSGTWYQPEKNYQGIFLEMIGGGSALAVWFTYQPDGRQAFFTAVGSVDGDRIVFPALTKTRGGRFGAAFDPAAVVREDWGSLVFTFESCGVGYASYLPNAAAAAQGWAAEQLNAQRLTSVAGIACPGGPPAGKYLHGGISGAWYDPARDGEGWLVEVLGANLGLVYWFSYTPTGEQAWFGGVAPIVDGSILVDAALRPTGGRFGPDYDPAQVTLEPWGAFRITIADCQHALVRAEAVAPFGSFANGRVQRLTSLAGSNPCAFTVGTRQIAASASAAAAAAVDGDVNDPNTALAANNDFAQAQALANPAVVPGYATQAPTGVAGDRFASAADPFDVYRVTIGAGQAVKLAIAEHSSARDFDLYLYAVGNTANPLAASEGTGPLEQIVVAASGDYYVVVRAFAGGGNYVLTVDSGGTAQAAVPGALSSFDKVVGDELVVVWRDPGVGKEATDRGSAKSRGSLLGFEWLAGAIGRPVLYALGPDALQKSGADTAGDAGLRLYQDPELLRAYQRVRVVKTLRARADVRSVDLNARGESHAAPNDPGYPFQWHYPKIQLPQALDLQPNANGVRVAVIDSGVAPHPELGAGVRHDLGFDFVADPTGARDGDGIDADADDPGDRKAGNRSTFHGTHVAGTIAALSNNAVGLAGVAPGAQIVPIRGIGSDGIAAYDALQTLLYLAGLPNDSGRTSPTAQAAVVNLSLGFRQSECPGPIADAFAAARARGVIPIASAGNDNNANFAWPAGCPGVVSVSATDVIDQRAPYSSFGPNVDVAAPGGDVSVDRNADGYADGVLSTTFNDSVAPREADYQFKNGTSMAAPHVAGVAALMKAAHPGLTPEQFDQALMSGALTVDLAGNGASVRDDLFGYGLIDAVKAVTEARRLAGGAATPGVLVAQPTALELGSTANQAQFDLVNAGQGSIGAVQASANQPWVSLVPPAGGGAGRWTVNVNRSGLVPAQYRAEIVLNSASGGSARVQLGMHVGEVAAGGGKLGRIYALLIDAATGMPIAQADAEAAGSYAFVFANRLPGTYLLAAGSDLDNDGYICDAGESCGIYPSFALPGAIVLGASDLALEPFGLVADTPGVLSGAAAALPAKRAPKLLPAPAGGWRRPHRARIR